MSSFKQRLGNALNNNFSGGGSSSLAAQNLMTPGGANDNSTIYANAGMGSTARKSMNASRMSAGANINSSSGGTNVLSDRVIRISEKINEIHVLSICYNY
jgi:hypothetical protein